MTTTTSLEHLSNQPDRQVKLFAQLAAVAVMAVGTLVLIGWVGDVEVLKSLHSGAPSMKANTALGLVLSGAALWLLAGEDAALWRRRTGLGFGVVVTLLGLLTLSQYIFGLDFGIDQMLFREMPGAVLTGHSGRMGANAALCFVLSGCGVLLLGAKARAHASLAQSLALVALLIALTALVGYAYGVPYLSRLASSTSMALHTALAFVVLSAGLLAARPRRPLMALLTRKSLGGLMLRRVWLQAILLFMLLGWLEQVGERAGWYEAAFGTALLVLTGFTLFSLLVWRTGHQLERLDAKRKEAESSEHAAEARLRVTLMNIGDAVISTDAAGCIGLMNQIAEELTGWKQEQAAGRPLEEVFRIVNEKTRATDENPVTKIISEGLTVRLVSQTLLITRDGRETPIENSCASIREAGQIIGVVLVFRDITKRKQADEQINYQLALTRSITDNTQSCLLMMDEQGCCTFANHATTRITGFRPEELIGEVLHYKIHHTRPDGTAFPINECGLDYVLPIRQALVGYEDTFVHQDGHFYPVRCAGSPIFKDGVPVGTLIEVQDITEEKRLLAAERKARELAEVANRLKDQFLATVSHELRTPLNHMLGWVVMLRGGQLAPEKAAEALATIERNVRAQNRLVEDLLDVSRIVTGKMQMLIQAVALAQVVEAAVASARPAAEAKNIRLQVVLDSRASTVSGDPDRLQQVVWNLISNAIKFTPKEGRVQVRLDRINSHIEITVSDTGEGLAPEFLPYVFDRFSQADGSMKRKHGGLGLGLAIVRHLVELHGGEVSVISPGLGQGATFTVTLPLRIMKSELPNEAATATSAQAGEPVTHDPLSAILKGVRVLVVDDEADSRLLLTVMLAESEAEVRTAGSLDEALKIHADWYPDVMISDIGMPNGDGYDLIREIRQRDAATGRWLPAVALTAYARSEDRLRAIKAGFQMHVAKPVEPQELLTVIASLTGRLDTEMND